MKQWRIQVSQHQGVVNRAFGGRVVSWSPWKTIYYYPSELEATLRFREMSGKGLQRVRIVYGSEVVAKSL